MLESFEPAVRAVERIGLAPALLLLLVVPLLWSAWQIVKWSGRRADRVIVAHVRMTRTFAANDTKHAEALERIAANDQAGHDTTHRKLDALHGDVRRALSCPADRPPLGPPPPPAIDRGAGDAR